MKTTYRLVRYSNGTTDLTLVHLSVAIMPSWHGDHALHCRFARLPLTCAHAHVILQYVDIRAAWSPTL